MEAYVHWLLTVVAHGDVVPEGPVPELEEYQRAARVRSADTSACLLCGDLAEDMADEGGESLVDCTMENVCGAWWACACLAHPVECKGLPVTLFALQRQCPVRTTVPCPDMPLTASVETQFMERWRTLGRANGIDRCVMYCVERLTV